MSYSPQPEGASSDAEESTPTQAQPSYAPPESYAPPGAYPSQAAPQQYGNYPQQGGYPQQAGYQQQGGYPQQGAPPPPYPPQVVYSPQKAEADKAEQMALLFGILGLFILGVVFGPLAITQANKAEKAGGDATAGKVLGWIGLILGALAVLFIAAYIVIMGGIFLTIFGTASGF